MSLSNSLNQSAGVVSQLHTPLVVKPVTDGQNISTGKLQRDFPDAVVKITNDREKNTHPVVEHGQISKVSEQELLDSFVSSCRHVFCIKSLQY
jgi:hypothetical protein